MTNSQNHKIGILAYGSLIDNSGDEISKLEVERIDCETPFNVEFARTSATRSNAPTLIPVEIGGRKVKGVVIVLNPEINIDDAKSILWRRELHKTTQTEKYIHSDNPSTNKVVIKEIKNLMTVETVLYTSIGCNIKLPLTSEILADFAIKSILLKAGQEEKDGLRYLLSARRNGIVTTLSEDYENQILIKTKTNSLEQAIEKLDRKRMMYPL